MRLSLGCGEIRHGNTIHVDNNANAKPDVLHDLNIRPWPFADGEFKEVIAEDIIEHLDSAFGMVEEAYRVLEPNGVLRIRTPHYSHINSWIDPTHKWHLTEYSFDYFDPETMLGGKYGYYTNCKFKIVRREISGGNVLIDLKKCIEGCEG